MNKLINGQICKWYYYSHNGVIVASVLNDAELVLIVTQHNTANHVKPK
jgi:hypothetical protein